MNAATARNKRKPTLNDRLRSLGLVFVLIVGGACTAIFSYVELAHQEQNIHRQLELTILLQQQFIDKWLDDRMSDIRLVANDSADMNGASERREELVRLVQSNHAEFRSVGFVGSGGTTNDGLDVRDRTYFAQAKQGKESISDVLRSRLDGKRIIVFAAPVMGPDHAYQGLVMGTVELTTIEHLMRQFTYGEQGQTYLADADGTLITGEGSDAERPVKLGEAYVNAAKSGIKSKHAYDDYRGVPVYGAYKWTKDGSWLIVGEAPKSDVLASLYAELKYASLFILLAMLAAVLIMLRTSKKIAAPVDQLLRGVRILEDGGYHYRIERGALESSTIEFQQLGAAFNSMADTIQDRTEALSAERNFASSIVDTAASLIVVLDRDGRILRFNRGCEQATGYRFEELHGESIFEKLIPEEEMTAVRAHFHELSTTGRSHANENHWRSRTGELHLIAWSNTVLQDPAGDIMHIIGIGIDITAQREAERALRESEERFRLIVGSMEEVVATYDSELRLTGVYGRATEDGFGPAGALEAGATTIHPWMDADNARLHADAQRLALGEKTSVLDWQVRSAAGAELSYQTSYAAFRANGREIKGVVSVSREITRLKASEAAHRETQVRMNNILESITDAFMALNNDWTFAYVNSEAERMLGRGRSQIMGKHLLEAFPLIADTPTHGRYRKAMAEQVPVSGEDYIPFLDAWYEVHVYPSKDGLSVYFQDVSLRKQLEQTAIESRQRLGTIIETVPSGIVVVGKDGVIAMANRMAESIFGMAKEDIVSRAYSSRIWVLYDMKGGRLPVEDYPVSVAMRTRRSVTNCEFVFQKPNGERSIISCNCSPLLDGEGEVSSVLVALSDITGRIAIQSELQAANDELKKLSSLDGLTGIFNRRYFNEQLHAEWNTHALKKEPLSLIMLDIDFFKAYNDTYGHLGGDMCLKTVASLIRHSLKQPNRFVARYGGEEFGVVLPGTTLQEAAELAEFFRVQIESREISHANSKVSRYLTISLGVASVVPAFGGEEESLVSAADKCLYEAKRTRNRTVVQGERGALAEIPAAAAPDFLGL